MRVSGHESSSPVVWEWGKRRWSGTGSSARGRSRSEARPWRTRRRKLAADASPVEENLSVNTKMSQKAFLQRFFSNLVLISMFHPTDGAVRIFFPTTFCQLVLKLTSVQLPPLWGTLIQDDLPTELPRLQQLSRNLSGLNYQPIAINRQKRQDWRGSNPS